MMRMSDAYKKEEIHGKTCIYFFEGIVRDAVEGDLADVGAPHRQLLHRRQLRVAQLR